VALCFGLGISSSSLAETHTPPLQPAPLQPPKPATPSRAVQDLAVRGIYVHQLTVQNPKKLQYLINNATKVGINTFVVDLWGRPANYAAGIKAIQAAGLSFVPRITVFPDGATPEQVNDQQLLEQRWRLIDFALGLGAKDVQLDYIRFSSRNAESEHNAGKILEVVRFFRQRLEKRGARLQIDIFGEVSYGPSTRIGQDISRLAPELDAVCPMLYPSHFEPYEQTAKTPYRTVHGALTALDRQIKANPVPVYAYIEHFNYRHPMSDAERAQYFDAQLQAVLDSKAQGFYVWSVGNYYDIVFNALRRRGVEKRDEPPAIQVASGTQNTVSGATLPLFGPPPPPQWANASAKGD
jgi:hypothetical protein